MGFGLRAALNSKLVRENRRAAPRHRYVGDDTWIRLEGCLNRLCQVLDLSRTGVRLAVTGAHSFPDTFTLILSKNGGGSRLARVKWCRGGELGAEFINADSSSASRLPANAPRANPASASRLTVDAPRSNSSAGSRQTAETPKAARPRAGEGEKSENLMSTRGSSLRTPAQQADAGKPKADLGTIAGGVDRADQEKSSQTRLDLSRLQKKLGPKHVALIDALKDVDPNSAHGRELAAIIESLDEKL